MTLESESKAPQWKKKPYSRWTTKMIKIMFKLVSAYSLSTKRKTPVKLCEINRKYCVFLSLSSSSFHDYE